MSDDSFDPDKPVGEYVLMISPVIKGEERKPSAMHAMPARVQRRGDIYELVIDYKRAGEITVQLHFSKRGVSFFITPDLGTIDGEPLISKAFFSDSTSDDSIAGWCTTDGHTRSMFRLQRYSGMRGG